MKKDCNDFYEIDNIKDDEIIKVLINPESGEIEGYIRAGDRIIRSQSVQNYNKRYENYEDKDDRNFTKNFHNELQRLTQLRMNNKLSMTAELLFRTFGDYLDFSGDNIIKNNNEAMGTKTIGDKILGYGKSQTILLMNELINLSLIAKVRRGRNVIYIMNPLYYHRGKVLKTTVTIFKIKTDNIEWDLVE